MNSNDHSPAKPKTPQDILDEIDRLTLEPPDAEEFTITLPSGIGAFQLALRVAFEHEPNTIYSILAECEEPGIVHGVFLFEQDIREMEVPKLISKTADPSQLSFEDMFTVGIAHLVELVFPEESPEQGLPA